jgi:hypothetical protein
MRFYSALAGERLWSFWHQYLHLPLPVLTLPLDKARPASSSFQADAVSLRLSEKSTSTLRLATERFGTTMQTVLMAAFQTFLFRYTGQDDILIGSPVSARADSSIYDILGQFLHFCFCVFQFFTSEYCMILLALAFIFCVAHALVVNLFSFCGQDVFPTRSSFALKAEAIRHFMTLFSVFARTG